MDEQPEELLISEDPELNKVVVYYATCEDQEEPAYTIEQQTYQIQYLLQDSGEPVPGLESVSGSAEIGSTVIIPHPQAEGYQVMDDQAAELVISEDAEQNQVIIYYQASETLPTVLVDQVSLTVKHIVVLDDGSEVLIDTEIIENLDRGTIFTGRDFVKDYDSLEFVGSDPEEITLDKEENHIALYYQLVEVELGDNPDGLIGPQEISAPNIYYPQDSSQVRSLSLMSVPLTLTSQGLRLNSYPGDHDNIEPPNPGSLALSKEAEPTDNPNQWLVTLNLTGIDLPTNSDIVLVIDRSGSMNSSGRIAAAKEAATQFVETLLDDPNDTSTRIAVVSFANNVTVDCVFQDVSGKQALLNAINGLTTSNGTFTQAGIKQAKALLDASTAEHKNIVLLSDGEPTYSNAIENINNHKDPEYFVQSSSWWYTRDDLDDSVYQYSGTAGNGNINDHPDIWCLLLSPRA